MNIPKRIIHPPINDNDPEEELKYKLYLHYLNNMNNEDFTTFLLNQITEHDLYMKQLLKHILCLGSKIIELEGKLL